MKTFLTRSISGILYAAVIFGSILAGPPFFALLLLFVQVAGLLEVERLIRKTGIPYFRIVYYALPLITYGIAALYFLSVVPEKVSFLLLPILFFSGLAHLMFSPQKPIEKIGTSLFVLFYLTIPLLLLIQIMNTGSTVSHPTLLLALFVLIWINDTFAYIVGSVAGKNQMVGSLSPKKTWEGAFGGLLFSLLAAWVGSLYLDVLSLEQWLGFAFVVVVFGNLGDLFESMLKRGADVKESGRLIPGHGGILDRFDSILIAGPFVYIYLHFILP